MEKKSSIIEGTKIIKCKVHMRDGEVSLEVIDDDPRPWYENGKVYRNVVLDVINRESSKHWYKKSSEETKSILDF